ncbi:DNA-damage-inducible protein J [Pediococcus damnosus]|uniref:DNA-damage-inducible protein J n=1 Tax=Pediococcus damnosus TaxID=51663 RepID=A0A143AMC1_9LACO|nr:type II toxin-antitoxin system RelB/DinJ family antitoxin [Pediococcus damnosus]AMV61018.1 DNA-damage-inducible protein J [Pediococcus damnosus]AMV63587.1 DNA-damage-inducible protein J [Pediococcus damnosus]AMV65378.1 DNA-damage-inducible protein J [Pediococcus damnosus]AMV66473.1 DNA-damage-inducible protein J [Pediococcus damnosus]AMV68775.1 DNA-damage-inducible protein J [Pediococcus damnosus]
MNTKSKDTRLSIRIEPELKSAGQDVAKDMGMDLTTAVKMFITAMVKEQRLPFEPTSLPVETLQALRESEHHNDYKTYSSAKEMWSDLNV